MNDSVILESIYRGLAHCQVEFDREAAAAALLVKFNRLNNGTFGTDYAQTMGFHFAVDMLRSVRVHADRRVKKLHEAEKLAAQEALELHKLVMLDAFYEFKSIAHNYASKKHKKLNEQLAYFEVIVFDGLTDEEAAEKFPGTRKDQRQQWKTRAAQFLLSHSSNHELCDFVKAHAGLKPI